MGIIVCKFGGTSTANADMFQQIRKILRANPDRRYVVLSAPGGAVKVTDYILSYLEENNLLRDHRGDPAYNDWNEALQRVKNKPLT